MKLAVHWPTRSSLGRRAVSRCLSWTVVLSIASFGCDEAGVSARSRNNGVASPAPENAILARIATILAEQLSVEVAVIDVNKPPSEQRLRVDDLDQIEIVMAVEEEFDIEIADDDVGHSFVAGDDTTLSIRKLADLVARISPSSRPGR